MIDAAAVKYIMESAGGGVQRNAVRTACIEEEICVLDKQYMAQLVENAAGKGNVWVDAPMNSHTSFKLGGPADVLVSPRGERELMAVLKLCRDHGVPVTVMGNGSNLLVRDKGIRGVVIKLFDNFAGYTVSGKTIEAQSGILLSRLASVALENGLTGLEFASGIPGTLGGAIVMNAGAYGGDIKSVVTRTRFLDSSGEIRELTGDEHRFGYRTSYIQEHGGIVLSSVLELKEGDKGQIKALMSDLNGQRRAKQPLEMPSAGSVFTRPAGYFTGKLIEDSGLKGYSIGGAQVSPKHCGFIVNTGNARTADVIDLIRHIQAVVKERYGVDLNTEVKIVGEE